MSKFPLIFRKHPSDNRMNNSQERSKVYTQNSNSSTRRSSLTSNCSGTSLWSSASSGISSLDVSLVTDAPTTESKTKEDESMKSENEVNVMVGKEIVNLNKLTAPPKRGRAMIRSEIMKCVANHTKVLEGVTREVREELASYHQKLISRKSNPRKQVKFKDQDSVMLENLGASCAETLKHIKNLYDQTRYLKGVINMMEDEFDKEDISRKRSGMGNRTPYSCFSKRSGYVLGCITIILLGVKIKFMYGSIKIPDIFNSLSYYGNLLIGTFLYYVELQPIKIGTNKILLDVT